MTDSKTVHGKNMIASIKVDGTFYPVFCGKSCSFSLSNEIINRTGVNSGLGILRRVRRTEFSGSASGVTVTDNTADRYSPFYLLQEAVRRAENEWQFEFINNDSETVTITGVFLIEGIEISGDVASFSQSTVNIVGSGLPVIDESPSGGGGSTATDENIDSDWWNVTAGTNNLTGLSQGGKTFAGKKVLAVSRSARDYYVITSGTATGDKVKHDTVNDMILFDVNMPFETGETVWIMWKDL